MILCHQHVFPGLFPITNDRITPSLLIFHPLHATSPPLRMVETSLLEQEPEPDIRSLSLRNIINQQQQHDQPTLSSQVPVAQHDDAIQQPRLNSTPIKEKDFVNEKPTVEHSNKAIFPALTRLRRPYQERDLSDGPIRSQSTPPASRQHVNFSANTKTKDDTPSAFATAEPLPPTRLNDVGPPRPPKNIAELFAPDRKLASDPGWTQSFVNTVKCRCLDLLLSLKRVLILLMQALTSIS